MATTIIRPKDRNEWLQYRHSGIGSSEVATIVGLNPWETPYQLWLRKTGATAPKQENHAMRRGHWCEDAVAQYWADTTGHEVIKSSSGDWLIVNSDKPHLRVSPDRTFWVDSNGTKHGKNSYFNKGILECKTTNAVIYPDDLPKHWFCQLQYQLGVAELQHGALAWMHHGFEFGNVDMDLVPDFYEWLVAQADKFWTENVLGGKEPEPINVDDVVAKFRRHTDGKVVEASEEVYNTYCNLKAVKEEIDEANERKAVLEDSIKMTIGDAEALAYKGQMLVTWKSPKASMKFDEKSFKEEHEDIWQQYARETQGSRRFLVK